MVEGVVVNREKLFIICFLFIIVLGLGVLAVLLLFYRFLSNYNCSVVVVIYFLPYFNPIALLLLYLTLAFIIFLIKEVNPLPLP